MLAVIIYACMAGEMENPLVIEKAARPRCCKKTCTKKLLADGKSNKKARTTCGGMIEHLMQRLNNRNAMAIYFWTVQPAILALNLQTNG
jgi:hypothetical protein